MKKIDRYVKLGADSIDFDILFGQLNAILYILKWMKENGYYDGDVWQHPAVKDTLNAINDLVTKTKLIGKKYDKTVLVGTWAVFISYLENIQIPQFDFVLVTPTYQEVKNLHLDEEKWSKMVEKIREKMGENVIIFSFIDNGSADTYPMHAFTQELWCTGIQYCNKQPKFLEMWDNFTRSLGIIPVYPIQDGVMGKTVWIKSYGKYNKFDALAPEFDLYCFIKYSCS